MLNLVKVGSHTINFDNVTEICEEDGALVVIYIAAWPDGSAVNGCARSCQRFYGDEAQALHDYISAHAADVFKVKL